MFHDWGTAPIRSTQAQPTSDPSTTTLIAEIDSTQFATISTQATGYRVFWKVGASTGAIFILEHATSTVLTAIRDRQVVFTGSNQSAQYLDTYKVEAGDRLRVRVASSFTGSVAATISAEPMT